MKRGSANFFLPKKDANKLRYLEKVEVTCENGDELLNLDEAKEEINLCLDTFKINEIIEIMNNIDLNNDIEIVNNLSSINYAIIISYIWNKLNSSNKKGMLVFLLNVIEYVNNKSRDSTSNNRILLFNILVFCVTNILFQEFDLLTIKIEEKKSNNFKVKPTNKTKRSKAKVKKSKYLYEESDESDSDDQTGDYYDNVDTENDTKNKHNCNTDELCYKLYKNLVDTVSSNIHTFRNMSNTIKEWLIILSLRVANIVQTIDMTDVEDEFMNNNWENTSEKLLVCIINNTYNEDNSMDSKNSDEYEGKIEYIFEIILNCILNSSIDMISNANCNLNISNKNNQVSKSFGNYLSRILLGIKEEKCGDIFLIYIFEKLELYWKRLDVVSDFEEDNKFISTLSCFIDSVSKSCPKLILNGVSYIRRILKVMVSYKLRSNFILSVTNSLININKNIDSLNNRPQIIETIDLLIERIYDSHQNCRTKTIQCLHKLMESNLIPYTFFISLLKEIKTRTLDESSYVRSSSFNLLRIMIRKATENYYQLSLNYDYLCTLIDSVEKKLMKINNNNILDVNEKILNNFACNETDNTENGDKKEIEYELMKVLLSDAREVSLIVESIIEEVCIHGIHSKTSSDVSSCILFICECVSLNIVRGLNHISSVFNCIWRVNNVSVLNSVIHGFYIIISDGNSSLICLEDQENENNNEQEIDDGRISISKSCVKNIAKVLPNIKEDDLINIMRILELLSSTNQTSNSSLISKKYTSNFDINLLRKYTFDEILEISDNIFENPDIEYKYISLIEFYTVILKVIVLNNNSLFRPGDNSFELFYDVIEKSIKKNNLNIIESTIKCINLMEVCDYYESKLINIYFNILTFNNGGKNGIHKHSLIFKVIDSVFMLLCNPSKLKFVLNNKVCKKVFMIDIFIKKLSGYYYNNYLGCLNELTLIKLSQIILSLTHITFKYGCYIENIYSKWKQLYSIYIKNKDSVNSIKKNSECGDVNLEEEYLEHVQSILEDNLISDRTVFNMIVPIVNIISRDPTILIDTNNDNVYYNNEANHFIQWQMDYSRNCSLISLCKLISISTELLNINKELINDNNLNFNAKLSYLLNNIPNIQLIFTLLYDPTSVSYIDKNQLNDIRVNIILSTNDLLTRYPNIMDPWMGKQYSLINKDKIQNNDYYIDKNTVEYNIMLIINYLLNIGFIKPKDELLLSYLRCIYSKTEFNTEMSSLSNSFFQEFFKDLNNQLSTNVIPSLINHLSIDYSSLYDNREKIQTIIQQMQYLLQFVSGKENVCCMLIPKFISRMSKTNDCKSLEFYIYSLESLKINSKAKCINKIIDNINLVQFHIQEFDFVKQFFYKIVKNYTSSNSSTENSHLLSLFEDIKSEKPNNQLHEASKNTNISSKNSLKYSNNCSKENKNISNNNI